MEISHHASELDPSSVLGFGSALAMLDSQEEVARLLTGALRSMGLADLQAVLLGEESEEQPPVYGSVGTAVLPDSVVDELRRVRSDRLSGSLPQEGGSSRANVSVSDETYPALADQGIDRLVVLPLSTIDHSFGIAVAGLGPSRSHSPVQTSSLQMMAAQVSMALHRIELDRQRAEKEEALRESETRYRELYENAPVAYVSTTADGTICMANQRATELLNAPVDELVGHSIVDFCADTPDGQAAAERLAAHLRDGGPMRDDEVELCMANGDRIWVGLTMRPLSSSTDDADRLLMMVDISDRRRVEAALREARTELETRVKERTAELEQANDRLERRTRRLKALRDIDQAILAAESPQEIAMATLRRARQIIPFDRASVSVIEEDRAHVLATRQEDEFLETGTAIPLEEYYLTDTLEAGETEIIPDLSAQSLPSAAEKVQATGIRSVLCLPMVAEDELIGILKIGRTDPEAFRSEERHVGEELADHLAIALRQARLLRRVDTRTAELEQTNKRLSHQTQRLRTLRDIDQAILAAESPEEIAGEATQRVRTILPYESATVTVIDWENNRARVLAAEDNILEPPTALPLDKVYISEKLRAGETEVISEEDYAPVPEARERIREMGLRSILCLPMVVEGDVIGVIHVGRSAPDAFTEHEWEVGRELADHMAIAIRQSRLLKEVQRRRERLEERVQERTEELESFTYSVSHDLRTPLRAIDGYTRILREEHADQLDEEGQRLLNVVYDSAQTMSDLIDDLLTLSRLGRRELNVVSIDMEALAREAYDELIRAHPDANATFEVGALPDALGDRSMIRHVLTNLLSNALKFTRTEASPRIEVRAEEREGRPVYVVRDNGVGFNNEKADELFGVFQRSHGADEFEGTGVGLAVVERIIRRHGGEVSAEGEEGEGATFFFTLPPPHDAD